MPGTREWREHLKTVWPDLDKSVNKARRTRKDKPDDLESLKIAVPQEGWLTHVGGWGCPKRGLGDFARFALARYIYIPGFEQRNFHSPEDMEAVQPFPWTNWTDRIRDGDRKQAAKVRSCLRRFDTQLRDKRPLPESAIVKLRALVAEPAFWNALAATANREHERRKQKKVKPLEGFELRNLRFAGPTAIDDFITYLNSGNVPKWQAPYPDDLADLGVHSPKSGEFAHEVPYFSSKEYSGSNERDKQIELLAEYCAEPPDLRFRVSCLYSKTEPHGLIAACNRLVTRYAQICVETKARRLPVVYIPVGLDMQAPNVSRREVIRDLHRKLCIGRRASQPRELERRALPKDATGEQIDAAIGAIRCALARCPTLLIFGIHHVPADDVLRAIEEEILDSPLPYAIDRLMPESGAFHDLIDPEDSYATHAVILADGPLEQFSTFDVHCVELPRCPAGAFPELLEWSACPLLLHSYTEEKKPNIVSSEIELSIVEAALALASSEAITECSLRQVARIFWEAPADCDRTPALLELFVDFLVERARTNVNCAWTITILQIVALSAGGLRRETAARVLSGYLLATGASRDESRPLWLAKREISLWKFRDAGPLSAEDVDALTREIVTRLEAFEVSAGRHIRVLETGHSPPLDAYPHLFESPEVPTFTFEFKKPKTLELRFPSVQAELCKLLKKNCPEKHTLLQRLLADEFLRRAAIVQRHGTDRDQLSLVEKRYAIAAIYHGLDSLDFARDSLLSSEGRVRSKWLLEPSNPLAAHHWIYRWLYVAHISGDDNALSRQHGAELLKIALLRRFLSTEQGAIIRRTSLRPFHVRSEVLRGLVEASLLSCNFEIAADAMHKLSELCNDVTAAVKKDSFRDPSRRESWLRQIGVVKREVVKLHLDGFVLCGKEFRPGGKRWAGWRLRSLIEAALKAEERVSRSKPDAQTLRLDISRALALVQESAPPFNALSEASRKIRQQLSRATAQYLYDYLARYAEIVANFAERQSRPRSRTRRQKLAIYFYEFAEALRHGTINGDDSEHALDLSARPTRTAGRLCLTIGRSLHKQGRTNKDTTCLTAANRYFERAAYCSFHFIGNLARYQVERVTALIVEAATIRIRSQIGKESRFDVAFEVIRTTERALIHYPSRLQLWLRFYLERAKLFRDRAIELGPNSEEAAICIRYSEADVQSVRRLAGGRKLWLAFAERVLEHPSLPRPLYELARQPSSVTPHLAAPRPILTT